MISGQEQSLRAKLAGGGLGEAMRGFLDYLRIEAGLAENTVLGYGRDLVGFADFCAGKGVEQAAGIDAILVREYVRQLSRSERSESTVNRALVAIKMFIRYGRLVGLVDDDFTSILESQKLWQKLPVVCSEKQVSALLNAPLPEEEFYYRDRAMLELLYATGMRASELTDLQVGDVNFKVGYLRCRGKGGRERVVPLSRSAIAAAQEYLAGQRPELTGEMSGDYLLLSRTGRPLGRVDIWRLVKKYAARAGLGRRLTVHTLRHCFATHLLAGGADLRSVQEMLGHVDIATTQIYTYVDQQRLKKIHKQFHPRP